MEPDAPARRVEEANATGGDLESIHAGASGGEHDHDEHLSGNVLDRVHRQRWRRGGRARLERRRRLRDVQDALGLPGLHRAAGGDGVARARRHARRSVAHAGLVRQPLGARASSYGLPLEQDRSSPSRSGAPSAAKFMLVEPLAAGAALALRRPVRLVITRQRGLRRHQPRLGAVTELEIGARSDGTLDRDPRPHDRSTAARTPAGASRASRRCSSTGPYRWEAYRHARLRRADEPLRFGAYRGPGAPPAAFALESLLDELAAQLDLDPIEFRLRNACVEGDPSVDGKPWPDVRRRECSRPRPPTRCGRSATRCRPARASASPSATGRAGRAGRGGLPLRLRRALTVVTGAVDMSGVEHRFATIAADTFGIPIEKVQSRRRPTPRPAPYAGASGGTMVTYSVGSGVQRRPRRRASSCSAAARRARDRARRPRDCRRRRARRSARPAGRSPSRSSRRALRFGGRYEPVEGHGGVGADEPGALGRGTHRARPRRPRDRRGQAARLRRSPRTSAARSTPRSSKARCAGAPRRRSAGRSTRSSSTTRTASS